MTHDSDSDLDVLVMSSDVSECDEQEYEYDEEYFWSFVTFLVSLGSLGCLHLRMQLTDGRVRCQMVLGNVDSEFPAIDSSKDPSRSQRRTVSTRHWAVNPS